MKDTGFVLLESIKTHKIPRKPAKTHHRGFKKMTEYARRNLP
jgi:hypothetical protein